MESLFLKVLNMSITASYVIIVILALRLLLARAPKKYSYSLWSVVGFRLICPLSLASVISMLNILDLSQAQTSGAALEYIPRDIGFMTNPTVNTGISQVNTFISETLPASEPLTNINPLQVWITMGTVLWGVGIALLLIYAVVTYLKARGRMATAVHLEGNVYESDQTRSPFILGCIKPKIYIPFRLGEKEKDYILRHEAYHIRRLDHLIKPLAFIVLAVHWFNPLAWLAFALLIRDMEMSCDEAVLSVTGRGIAKDYSLSLLSFATNTRFAWASPLAFGETGVKQRVTNVLRFKKPKFWMTISVSLLCMAVIVACGANPNKGKETPPDLSSLYGRYRFTETIYMNPISSFMPVQEYMPHYVLSEEGLVIEELDGTETKVPGVFEAAVPVTEADFKQAFSTAVGIPDISVYRERFQFTLNAGSYGDVYRLYYLDGSVWLAQLHQDKIWSIYELLKTNAPIPGNDDDPLHPGAQEQVHQFLYDLFDSGKGMLSTLEVTGYEPRTYETSNRWYAERYGVLFKGYVWRHAQENVIPQSSDYTLSLYSTDKSKFFRFFAGSDTVLYSDDGKEYYYLATAARKGGWDIAATIRSEYDGLEVPLQSLFVETQSRDFLEVANLFMQEYGRQQLARSPGSYYAITDFAVVKNRVYLTQEGDDTKFCFMTTFAVKPVDYDSSPWWAGGTEAGSGELQGYIKVSLQIRLDRDGNIWRCTNIGTGGVGLD